MRRTYKSTGAVTVLCGALSLFISLLYAARLVRPIHILHAAVEKVAHGDLHARAEVRSHDEIERLAEAFNDMAHTILGRNQILESVSFAAKQFLSAADPNVVAAEVLERIGEATGASRAYVMTIGTSRMVLSAMLAQQEWSRPASVQGPEGESLFWQGEAASSHWIDLLSQGRL